MKKITFLALLSFLTLNSIGQDANGQNKFGHIDANELLLLMPETELMQNEIAEFQKTLESQLGSMNAEYQQMYQEFQANKATYDDLVKQDKIAEIEDKQRRLQSFEQNARETLQTKQQELLEPILSKARQAIQDVATEGDFTYIFDASIGSILYAKESKNILPIVKNKLGL